jgi:hypothetical protein
VRQLLVKKLVLLLQFLKLAMVAECAGDGLGHARWRLDFIRSCDADDIDGIVVRIQTGASASTLVFHSEVVVQSTSSNRIATGVEIA